MSTDDSIVRFGVFEVDLKDGELRKRGIRIKLQDLPFQMLRVLIERPGEIVTRDELRASLWPDGTFVDFDHSMNASINRLREALGDTASNSRFIETVPRRGYRFIAPIERTRPSSLPQPTSQPPRRRWKGIAISGALTLVVVTGGIAAWRVATARRGPVPEPRPLTSTPGQELQPSFSPDGNYVAYTGGPGLHRPDVYIKQIGSETLRRLTSDPAPDVSPKWSPDGRHVAFVRVLRRQLPLAAAAVLIVPALGGQERKIADTWITMVNANVVEWLVDWFPDSENLVVADGGPGGERCALFGVNTRTGERWRLTTPPATGLGDLDPAVSPDGRSIVFTRHAGRETTAAIHLLQLDSQLRPASQPRPITTATPSRGPVWTTAGREILFASGPRHSMRLWRMHVSPASTPQRVPFGVEGTFPLSAAVSRRSQLAYPVFHAKKAIYRTELPAKGGSGRTERFLQSSFFEHMPEYSPDGTQVAFVTNRSGSQQIWMSDSEGRNPYQLTFLEGNLEAGWPRWSPDGRRLVFGVAGSVYVAAIDGGPSKPLLKNVGEPAIADWSPDGKWIYFLSNRSGRAEVWKVPVREGASELSSEMLPVTKKGGGAPRASPDGRFIYYAKGSHRSELWKVPVEGGDEVRVVEALSTNGSFALVEGGIYFAPPPDGPGTTWLTFLDTRTGSQTKVAPVRGFPGWGMSVSRDGRYILRMEIIHEEAEGGLMLVENFR